MSRVEEDVNDFECYLNGRMREGKEMVLKVVQSLGSALVYPDSDNIDTNRKLWDCYAREWGPDEKWVQKIACGDDKTTQDIAGSNTNTLHCLGDEWSDTQDLEYVIDHFIHPYLAAPEPVVVAEIGSGGGRVASRVVSSGNVLELHCYDISQEMLKVAQQNMQQKYPNVQYHWLQDATSLPKCESFDFVYAFDVFVHLDLHTMFRYFKAIYQMLKVGGKAFVSTANLLAPRGFERFEAQSKYTVGGFYFVSPEIVQTLVEKSGLKIVSSGQESMDNIYLSRDYLVVVEKPVRIY